MWLLCSLIQDRRKDFYLGMDDFMKMVGADVVFPMHFWGDFEVTDRLRRWSVQRTIRTGL